LITIEQNGEEVKLVLRPNCSLSWRGNQVLFLCIAVWLGSFGIAFAAMGAWVILPFVGIELLLIAAALYHVSWKLSHREVLHITPEQVYVAKGVHYPKHRWVLPREQVVVHVSAASHPWGRPTIQLLANRLIGKHAGAAVQIGGFLNQDDCKELLRQLVSARLATRHSSEGQARIAF
jgi:uncharacterized membrane protein